MAIKQLLELIGDDIVIAKLGKVQKAGEAALATFNQPLQDLKFNVPDPKPLQDFSEGTVKLKDALHALRPIMQAAGVQFSEFGGLIRLASASLPALAAATAGAMVVALARLEENAKRTKGTLADLFGSSDKGSQAFTNLEKQAAQFGTTVEGLAPGLESFQAALNSVDRTAQGFRALKESDLPGAQLAKDADAVSAAYGNFIKLLRAGRLDQDQAEKSAKAFFDTMKDGGGITSAALKNLPTGTITLLKDAFGQAGLTARQFFALVDSGAISVDAFEKVLINFGPQAQLAFDTKAIKTLGDELNKTFSVLKEGFKSLSGTELSDFLNNQIKLFRQGLQGFLIDLQKIRDFVRAGLVSVLGEPQAKTTEQGFDEAGFIALGDAVGKLPPKFISASNSVQNLGAAALSAGKIATKAVDGINASLQGLRDKAKETGEEMQSVIVGGTEFKGRLNQIRVSRPQLAGEFDPVEEAVKQADAAAKAAKAAFIDNPFFKDGVTIPIKPALDQEVANTLFKDFKPVIPTAAQEALVNSFTETGLQSGEFFITSFDQSVTGKITSLAQSWWQAIQSVFTTPIPVSFDARSPLQSTAPFASGGMVRGPGSGTSDSILAWLSNREYVVNARAVSHYGPDLFAALNAMRLPRDFINRFSMGGLARAISGNRFAAGGQVRSSNPVVLKIDRQSFNMTAGDDTIAQLKRFAVTAQLSSTGRKPRWVR